MLRTNCYDKFTIDCCLIQFWEKDKLCWEYSLKDLRLRQGKNSCNCIIDDLVNPTEQFNEADVIALGFADLAAFKAFLLDERKKCKAEQVTIEGEIDVTTKTAVPLTVCDSEGNICSFIGICEDGVWTYTGLDGVPIDAATFDAEYDLFKPAPYKNLLLQVWYSITDKYLENPIQVVPRLEVKTGLVEYFDCADTEFLNPLNIKNYMSNHVGAISVPKPPRNSTGVFGGELCPTATLQDILDDALTNPQFVLPDGTQPNGILYVKIQALGKGHTCDGNVVTIPGATIGKGIASLDAGQSWCLEQPFVDADCDNFAGLCADLTTAVVTDAAGGIVYEVIGVNCDADDADPAVQ